MAELEVEGAAIHYVEAGQGEPLVLVHGSWDEHVAWGQVVPPLAESFRVLAYDRRGHGRSSGGGPVDADVDDLAALIEHAGAPAHVAANSFGSIIALRLATRRPEMLRSLALHEPPLLGLLGPDHPAVQEAGARIGVVLELLESGRTEEGARSFVEEVAIGPGAWEQLPQEDRDMMQRNAHTFVEENSDPTALHIDVDALGGVAVPVLISGGEQSPPFFAEVLEVLDRALPQSSRQTLADAGHIPHETNAGEYVAMVRDFAAAA